MIALVVTIQIKPGHKEAFMASMLDDAMGSNNDEPGCLRFDVLQNNEDPNKIHLYEVYKDQAAVDAHRQAPHYTKKLSQNWWQRSPLCARMTSRYVSPRS